MAKFYGDGLCPGCRAIPKSVVRVGTYANTEFACGSIKDAQAGRFKQSETCKANGKPMTYWDCSMSQRFLVDSIAKQGPTL